MLILLCICCPYVHSYFACFIILLSTYVHISYRFMHIIVGFLLFYKVIGSSSHYLASYMRIFKGAELDLWPAVLSFYSGLCRSRTPTHYLIRITAINPILISQLWLHLCLTEWYGQSVACISDHLLLDNSFINYAAAAWHRGRCCILKSAASAWHRGRTALNAQMRHKNSNIFG